MGSAFVMALSCAAQRVYAGRRRFVDWERSVLAGCGKTRFGSGCSQRPRCKARRRVPIRKDGCRCEAYLPGTPQRRASGATPQMAFFSSLLGNQEEIGPRAGRRGGRVTVKWKAKSVYLVVGADVCEHDDLFPTRGIGFEGEDNPTVVLDPASPQPFKLTPESMGSQSWVERVRG